MTRFVSYRLCVVTPNPKDAKNSIGSQSPEHKGNNRHLTGKRIDLATDRSVTVVVANSHIGWKLDVSQIDAKPEVLQGEKLTCRP